jgi:hypothetical protein
LRPSPNSSGRGEGGQRQPSLTKAFRRPSIRR